MNLSLPDESLHHVMGLWTLSSFLPAVVPKPLVELHIKLLRKLGKSVTTDRWEKYLAKVSTVPPFGWRFCPGSPRRTPATVSADAEVLLRVFSVSQTPEAQSSLGTQLPSVLISSVNSTPKDNSFFYVPQEGKP